MHTAAASNLNTFWCLPVRREGAPIPRWLQAQASWHFGELAVDEELDSALHRHILIARFHAEGRIRELLQPLREAKLLLVGRERMVLLQGFVDRLHIAPTQEKKPSRKKSAT